MANNTVLPGTGETYAAKDRDGVKFQQVLVQLDDSPSVDAFGRLRVSNAVSLFDSKLITADKRTLFWDELLQSGAGIASSIPTANKPYTDFTSTINTAGNFIRQTFRRFNYQPGKSHLIDTTGVLHLSGGGVGVKRIFGYMDDNNGVFFEDDNNTVGVAIRSSDSGSPVDTRVIQDNWNIDGLDIGKNSLNPSGLTVDWTKAQIFIIDFQWLSVGRVRIGLEIGGVICYVHEFNTANVISIPWTSTPNLPLRQQMITTSSSPASTMRVICSTVMSEGGEDAIGLDASESTTDHVAASVADTVYALVGLRLKSSHFGCTFKIQDVSVIAETSDDYEWLLIHNPTIAGAHTFTDKTDTCVQRFIGDTGGANTITGGFVTKRGFGSGNSAVSIKSESSLSLGSSIDGTPDEVVLAVRPLGINAQIQGAVNWKEVI